MCFLANLIVVTEFVCTTQFVPTGIEIFRKTVPWNCFQGWGGEGWFENRVIDSNLIAIQLLQRKAVAICALRCPLHWMEFSLWGQCTPASTVLKQKTVSQASLSQTVLHSISKSFLPYNLLLNLIFKWEPVQLIRWRNMEWMQELAQALQICAHWLNGETESPA